MVDRIAYNTVLSQVFSPCGNNLVASNLYGDIAVYKLSVLQDDNRREEKQKPHHVIKDSRERQICSLASSPNFLLSGSNNVITGWSWKTVLASKDVQPSFSIQIPSEKSGLEAIDVNCMLFNAENNHIYAGCGDSKVYVCSLEDGKIIRSMEGHSNFIHSVHAVGNQLVSASEDGTVRLWDIRQSSATNVIVPHKHNKLARPELGKWIGAAAISNDWLVCGGGPKLSLWHLRSLGVTTVFSIPDLKGVHVAKFHEDRIFAGGAGPNFYQLGLKGHTYAQIPISATTVYSAEFQESPHKVLAIAGSSCNIDICTNFFFADQIFTFAS